MRKLAAGFALVAATLTIAVSPALAASPTVFRNVPTTLPGNVPSQAFEATSTAEFGDLIQLAAGERSSANLPVTVVMSSWACEKGGDATCATTPGATWSQELTLKLYSVKDVGGTPTADAVLLTKAQTFAIPYRPSYDPSGPCAAIGKTGWYSALETKDPAKPVCYNGMTYPAVFDLSGLPGVNLPDQIIWSLSFNTADYGAAPIGKAGPYNSLNVALSSTGGQPAVGTDVDTDSVFINSGWSEMYNNIEPYGVFRAAPAWSPYEPMACFGACPINLAAAPTPTPPPPATPTPTLAPTPVESILGASATPVEQVGGATATPRLATPPVTSSNSPSDGGSSGLLVLLIGLGFGSLGLVAAAAQRRTLRS